MSGRSARDGGRRREGFGRQAVRFWLGWFVVLNVIWLALISGFDVAETILGLLASAIAATAATAVRQTRLVSFRPRPSWFLAAWRLPLRTVVETVQVFGALWRRVVHGEPIQGRFRTEPFPLGREAERAAARRAIRTIAESVAPNTFVVGIDEEEHTVLVHELVAGSPPRSLRAPHRARRRRRPPTRRPAR